MKKILLIGFDYLFLDICREFFERCPILNPCINHILNTSELYLVLKHEPDSIVIEIPRDRASRIKTCDFLYKHFRDVRKIAIEPLDEPWDGHLLEKKYFDIIISRKTSAPKLFQEVLSALNISDERVKIGQSKFNLTPKERIVSSLILLGHTNSEIRNELRISNKTLDTHKQNIFKKVGSSKMAVVIPMLQGQEILV